VTLHEDLAIDPVERVDLPDTGGSQGVRVLCGSSHPLQYFRALLSACATGERKAL
jgi:hypothetical protein